MTDTGDRILSYALEVLAGEDAGAFTMRKVADDLELSSGSVFHAFPSRDALIAAAFAEAIGLYHAAAIEAIDHDDPLVALQRFVTCHLQWVEANAGLARFLFTSQTAASAAEVSGLLGATNANFAEAQSRLFAALSGAGLMGDIDDRLAHSLTIGPSQEYCRKWLRGSAHTPPSRLAPTLEAGAVAALGATMAGSRPSAPAELRETKGDPVGPGVASYRGVVYPWHCDHMGHMNVMWYSSKFDEATWHFFGHLGLGPVRLEEEHRAVAAIDQHTKYLAELRAGDLVEITTHLIEHHDKVLVFEHKMINSVSKEVAATSRLTGIHLDAKTRRSQSLPDDVKRAAGLALEGSGRSGV